MTKKVCGYCGEEYDEKNEQVLDNGSPACPQCVADEDLEEGKRQKESGGE